MHPNAAARFDKAIAAYLDTLPRERRQYAAHVAHHTRAQGAGFRTRDPFVPPADFGLTEQTASKIRQQIDAISRAATVPPDEPETPNQES